MKNMDIDRHEYQGNTSRERIKFVLDQLEKSKEFKKGISWETEVVNRLTIEEIIGALVAAEQNIIGDKNV